MPNGYATVPAIIPGNVTITGDTFKVGSAAGFSRLIHAGLDDTYLTHNYDVNFASDAVRAAMALDLSPSIGALIYRIKTQGAGAAQIGRLAPYMDSSGNPTQITGTTAETTAYTHTIQSNVLQNNGSARVRIWFDVPTQGATPTTVRIKLGGSTIHSFTVSAPAQVYCDVWIQNANSSTTQAVLLMRVVGGAVTQAFAAAAVDMSTDITVAVTVQPGTNTDVWNRRAVCLGPEVNFN